MEGKRQPLDPIVSLAVAIAEEPGSYAFFVGSGVSRDAGVPTGAEVFWLAVAELHRLDAGSDETLDQPGLQKWLDDTGRSDFDYSNILELIAPDPPTRRAYLAKHFENIEPGPAHERLAELATAGEIRVFVTTNFDRLLERALEARGVTPIVVTSAAELASAPRREHAACYVVKPHGDYLQETIRNTRGELSDLGAEITGELKEIFDRYGLVVLGYGGADEGIAQVLRGRSPRYGVYWVTRGDPGAPAQALIHAVGGRLVKRETASAFLTDLQRRLAVYGQQPSGHTPLEVHDEVLNLVRAGDKVGLAEVMRRERQQFAAHLDELVAKHRQEPPAEELFVTAYGEILPIIERRLAGLLPLLSYDEDALSTELQALCTLLEVDQLGGYRAWVQLPDWSTWVLAYTLGAFALRSEKWQALSKILSATFTRENLTRHLADPVREDVGSDMGPAVLKQESGQKWISPRWVHLRHTIQNLGVIAERWPEFVAGDAEPYGSMENFDFLNSIYLGLEGRSPVAYWGISYGGAVAFARRLRRDDSYRRVVAEALGIEPDLFMERAAEGLQNARSAGQFVESVAFAVFIGEEG